MNSRVTLVGLGLALAASMVSGGTLQSLENGSYRHEKSGWIYPAAVGDFRLDKTGCLPDLDDCTASYSDGKNHATVYVYSPSSKAEDASLAGAVEFLEARITGSLLDGPSWVERFSEGPFRVGDAVQLRGNKVYYKIGMGPGSVHEYLYYFDTGAWIIKIRVSGPTNDRSVFGRIDGFVRGMPWTGLLTDPSRCTGAACATNRVLPIRTLVLETLSMLLAETSLREPSSEKAACDHEAIATAMSSATPRDKLSLDLVASCTDAKRRKFAFVRMELPANVRDQIDTAAPEGLSLIGPAHFMIVRDRKVTSYTAMHDGMPTAAIVSAMIARADDEAALPFAQTNEKGKLKRVPAMVFSKVLTAPQSQ